MELCRDRMGAFNATFFRLWSCSMCYTYLFHESNPAFFSNLPQGHQLVGLPFNPDLAGVVVYPDVDNPDAVGVVCSTLKDAECDRWTRCCRAAEECCQDQLRAPHPEGHHARSVRELDGVRLSPGSVSSSAHASDWDSDTHRRIADKGEAEARYQMPPGRGGGVYTVDAEPRAYCPRTWDGFGCFRDTQAGQRATINCPAYIDQSDPHARAYKECTENGTWWRDGENGQEWTDYTTCVKMDAFLTLFYVKVTCNAVSLSLLIPACVIFLAFRKLRVQHRVQIHVHLFLSFIMTNVVLILWECLVYNDRLHNPAKTSLMYKNTVGCKILYVLSRYAWTCNFCWMFLEGFHLHRLIVRAFETPKSILAYYITGWGGSWVPVLVYVVIRALRKDSGCWVKNIEGFEWIIYIPNVLCIAVNLFFLFSILRILLTQLQSHPNEPSNYRRALKATAVLVPLFGLQLFLVIYSPHQADSHVTNVYEIVAAVVTNSQGALVALIFCFFNKEVGAEVLTQLKTLRGRCHGCISGSDLKAFSSHTYVMTERVQGRNGVISRSPERSRGEYIAVTTQHERPNHLPGNGATTDEFV